MQSEFRICKRSKEEKEKRVELESFSLPQNLDSNIHSEGRVDDRQCTLRNHYFIRL